MVHRAGRRLTSGNDGPQPPNVRAPDQPARDQHHVRRDRGTSTATPNTVKQLNFAKHFARNLSFGGSLLKRGTNPKRARPLDSKRPVHLVLRAEKSTMRQPRHYARVNEIVSDVARRRGLRIYEYANVGNHLHLLLKLPRRRAWNAFIREVTGRIARLTRVRWANRPFTRVVAGWRKAYRAVKDYVRLNRFEAERGLSPADATFLRVLRKQFTSRGHAVAAALTSRSPVP